MDISISLPFPKVQAVFLQDMAADDTIIVKVRLSHETEEERCPTITQLSNKMIKPFALQ